MAPYTWKRIPRETAWGRRQVLHVFEPERPEQTVGKGRGQGHSLPVAARGLIPPIYRRARFGHREALSRVPLTGSYPF